MKKLFYSLLILVAAACSSHHEPAEMNVATYNLRLSNGGDSIRGNGWGQRAPYVAKLIQYHDFDIFGCSARGVTLENIGERGRALNRTLEEEAFFSERQFRVITQSGEHI